MKTERNKKYFLMVFPLYLNFFLLSAWRVVFTIVLFNFFLASSLQGESVVVSIDGNEALFLENLMLRDGGLFTLLGSKPMTEFNVTDEIEETEEEFANSYQEVKDFLEQVKQEPGHPNANTALPSYEEFKEKRMALHQTYQFCERKKVWDEWICKRGHISNPMYKLLARERGHKKVGLFINVAQLRYILKKYHSEFSQIVQMEFDPDTIIDSIDKENAIFWEKVFNSHYLHGLLLGYGEKNAYLFDWVRRHSFPLESIAIHRFPELSRLNQYSQETHKKNITVTDLPIPYFVSFEIDDKEIEHYSKEREKIIHFLKDKDFIPFVVKCLQINQL